MREQLFLGVEGGATRTTGVLADAGLDVVARHVAGPTNVHAVGEGPARRAAGEIVRELRRQAGDAWGRLAAAAFCVAALRSEADRSCWRRIADDAGISVPLVLTHDAAAGLAAGSESETGVLVVCGTGSLVYGRRADGQEHFVGGRGAILGDEGSGFDIGLRGLRAAVRASDGRGRATVLERLIPERLDLADLGELVAWVSPFAKDRIAGVAPIVFEAAAGGDGVAQEVLRTAAGELVRGVRVVVDVLWPDVRLSPREPIVLAGGVLRAQPAFRDGLAVSLGRLVPSARCTAPAMEGAVGAARVAQRQSRAR